MNDFHKPYESRKDEHTIVMTSKPCWNVKYNTNPTQEEIEEAKNNLPEDYCFIPKSDTTLRPNQERPITQKEFDEFVDVLSIIRKEYSH